MPDNMITRDNMITAVFVLLGLAGMVVTLAVSPIGLVLVAIAVLGEYLHLRRQTANRPPAS